MIFNRPLLLVLPCLCVLLAAGCSVSNRSNSSKYFQNDGPPDTGSRQANSGKYFQNDGPPRSDSRTAGAQKNTLTLQVEKPNKWTNRPYTVMGKRYYPMTGDRPLTQIGIASWYGKQFHNRKTSTGEIYNMFALSAAHPTMELPSFARVTNLSNGKSVIVRVNDRGPFLGGRIIDMSYAAAVELDYVKKGTAKVKVERITREQIASGRAVNSSEINWAVRAPSPIAAVSQPQIRESVRPLPEQTDSTAQSQYRSAAPVPDTQAPEAPPAASDPLAAVVADTAVLPVVDDDPMARMILQTETQRIPSAQPPAAESATDPARATAPDTAQDLQPGVTQEANTDSSSQSSLEQQSPSDAAIAVVEPGGQGLTPPAWSAQIGSFSTQQRAQEAASLAQQELLDKDQRQPIRIVHDGTLYRVLVGQESDAAAARQLSDRVSEILGISCFIIKK